MGTDTNVKKVKRSSSRNINQLKPFTILNHKEKVVKKKSKSKIVAALMTGGTSLLITGTKSNKGKELQYNDCGKM
jgi:hypothetical protein